MTFTSELRLFSIWLKCFWLVSVSFILLASPSSGYIINERGRLIPFRLYKKEGYTMCIYHPRNCRSYHKRLLELPRPDPQMHKRGVNWLAQRKANVPGDSPVFTLSNDDIFDPGYDMVVDDDDTKPSHRQKTLDEIGEELQSSSQISPYPITDPRNSITDFTTYTDNSPLPVTSSQIQKEMRLLAELERDIEEDNREIPQIADYRNEAASDTAPDAADVYEYITDAVRQSLDAGDSSNIVIPNSDLDLLDYRYR